MTPLKPLPTNLFGTIEGRLMGLIPRRQFASDWEVPPEIPFDEKDAAHALSGQSTDFFAGVYSGEH